MNPFENKDGGSEMSNVSLEALNVAAKWSKFLAILGFIYTGFSVLGGIFMVLGGLAAQSSYRRSEIPMPMLGLVYLVLAVVYFIPSKKLNDFSGRASHYINHRDSASQQDMMENLGSFFKTVGIMAIVMLVLGFLFGFIFAAAILANAGRF